MCVSVTEGVTQLAILEGRARSEEHTSELQSQAYLVGRLLLEKKNLNRFSSVEHTAALQSQ